MKVLSIDEARRSADKKDHKKLDKARDKAMDDLADWLRGWSDGEDTDKYYMLGIDYETAQTWDMKPTHRNPNIIYKHSLSERSKLKRHCLSLSCTLLEVSDLLRQRRAIKQQPELSFKQKLTAYRKHSVQEIEKDLKRDISATTRRKPADEQDGFHGHA